MGISKNALKYIMMFLGVLIFIALYLLVYTDYTAKTDAVNLEIATMNTRLSTLSNYNTNLKKYTTGIADAKAAVADILGKYSSMERPEDYIMLAADMESKVGLTLNDISFAEPIAMYAISGVKDGKSDSKPLEPLQLMCYKLTSTFGGTMKYDQMKKSLEYISRLNGMTKLGSLSLTYDSSSGLINGSFGLEKYYITGRDIAEHQTTIPSLPLGKNTLFGA